MGAVPLPVMTANKLKDSAALKLRIMQGKVIRKSQCNDLCS